MSFSVLSWPGRRAWRIVWSGMRAMPRPPASAIRALDYSATSAHVESVVRIGKLTLDVCRWAWFGGDQEDTGRCGVKLSNYLVGRAVVLVVPLG